MRNVLNGAWRCISPSLPIVERGAKMFLIPFAAILLMTSCSKEAKPALSDHETNMKVISKGTERNAVSRYSGLSFQTAWELQQARAATAKYKNIQNAFKDGYADIKVKAPNMGYHFMREAIVDATFDFRNPEILVYNKDDKGEFYLVAVEYAVPIHLPRPSGFSGDEDQWDNTSAFPFWLLHAWVWEYNPEGVFHPTNALVHVH